MPPTENIGCTSVFSLEEILEFEFHLSSTLKLVVLSAYTLVILIETHFKPILSTYTSRYNKVRHINKGLLLGLLILSYITAIK